MALPWREARLVPVLLLADFTREAAPATAVGFADVLFLLRLREVVRQLGLGTDVAIQLGYLGSAVLANDTADASLRLGSLICVFVMQKMNVAPCLVLLAALTTVLGLLAPVRTAWTHARFIGEWKLLLALLALFR